MQVIWNKFKTEQTSNEIYEALTYNSSDPPILIPKEYIVLDPFINPTLSIIEEDEFYDRPG